MVTGTISSDGIEMPSLTTLETASRSAAMLRAAQIGRLAAPPSVGLFIETLMKYTAVLG